MQKRRLTTHERVVRRLFCTWSVEAELHRYFADKRVNRINTRREFFYATPAEVRDALAKITGNLLEFTEEPKAEQYRLSLQLATDDAQTE